MVKNGVGEGVTIDVGGELLETDGYGPVVPAEQTFVPVVVDEGLVVCGV